MVMERSTNKGNLFKRTLLPQNQLFRQARHNNGSILVHSWIMNQHGREKSCSFLISKRWTVAYMGLYLGLMNLVYRVNINVALPFMTKTHPSVFVVNDTNRGYNISFWTNESYDHSEKFMSDEACPEVAASGSKSLNAELDWSKKDQSLVLTGFYYGYIFQFSFGWLAGRYGGKHIILVSMTISCVLMLLFPLLARFSVYAVVIARAILGLFVGAGVPAWYKLVSQWALPTERSRFTGILWFGQMIGTIVGFFFSGFLCAHGFDNGWGSVFYVHGSMGVFFLLLWAYIVYDSPTEHPRISGAEVTLLTSQATCVDTRKQTRQRSVPWRRMLTYGPVWVVISCHVLDNVLFYTILNCMPLYMKAVLRFDIQSNGIFSSLPFICCAMSTGFAGVLADNLISRRWLSTTNTRKVIQVTSFLGSSTAILVTGYQKCDQRDWVVVLLCLCIGFDGLGHGAGYLCTVTDIAPKYASEIFGISNSLATVAGIIAPLIVAELTPNETAEEWRTVFFIAAGCSTVAAVVFGVFSSSELAPWAADDNVENNPASKGNEDNVV